MTTTAAKTQRAAWKSMRAENLAIAEQLDIIGADYTSAVTEHAGLKIYPIKVKMGDAVVEKWAVQTPDNAQREKNGERQIGGDPLSDTLDEAKKNAESEVRVARERAERDAESKAEEAAAQAKKDANKGKSILQRRADALLDKQHTYPPQAGLGQGTRREAIQSAVDQGRAIVERMVPDTAAKNRDQAAIDLVRARGYILGLSNENIPVVKQGLEAQARMKANQYEKPEYRVYDSAKTDGGFYEITKTEYDYAQKLIAESAPKVEQTEQNAPRSEGVVPQKPAAQATAQPEQAEQKATHQADQDAETDDDDQDDPQTERERRLNTFDAMTTITIDSGLLEQALNALECCYSEKYDGAKFHGAKAALRAALAAQRPAPDWHDAPEREAFDALIKDAEHIHVPSAEKAWKAACAWQKRKDEAICAEFSQDAYARYRAGRREYDDGQCDAANALADKIRSGE